MKKDKEIQTPVVEEKKPSMTHPMLVPIIFCLISGILLIVLRENALQVTSYVLAAIMIGSGIWHIISYFRSEPMLRILQCRLAIGLILLVSGALLAFNPDSLNYLLPYAWGLALFFGGFLKIQYAFDRKTSGSEKWWILLILAALSIILGVMSLLNPFLLLLGDSKELVIGILLAVEAVLDITVFLTLESAIKKHTQASISIPHEGASAPNTPSQAAEPEKPVESVPETEA